MKLNAIFCWFSISLFFTPSLHAQNNIILNEVMASNATTISDEDGDYEDWIELFNPGEQATDLSGYGLSDDYDDLFKWVFPKETFIYPGEFMLIWASGKDQNDPEKRLHTNFRIYSGGEELLLTQPDGITIDELPPTPIPTDISYGRKPNGGENWYFFIEPTPGQSNTSEAYDEILTPPVFSRKGGFYENGFYLEITHPSPDVTIIYTLDGSIPCENNLQGTSYTYKNHYAEYPWMFPDKFREYSYKSKLFSNPILIKDRSQKQDKINQISTTWHLNPYYFPKRTVFKGTVVRAIATKEGNLPSSINTNSYFINPEERSRYSLPVISISVQEDALFDYDKGIYVAGVDFDQWRLDNPVAEIHNGVPGNYHRRGREWEVPVNFEYFDPNSTMANINQLAGLRIHGGFGRAFPRKSFRLYARSAYGTNRFSHPFFANYPYSEFSRLMLRNSGDDGLKTNFRDALIQTVVQELRFDTQAYQPTVLMLNGEYWGVLNLRERYDRHYLQRAFNLEEGEIDLLSGKAQSKEGDALHYNETLAFIEDNSMDDEQNYQYIKTRIDIDNYIDYQLTNIYIRNVDWPSNNIDFWRKRTEQYEPDAPYGHDGRWRWLLYDTDAGLGGWGNIYNSNMLEFATQEGLEDWPNPDWSTFLFRELLKSQTFRNDFINRFADIMNTLFTPSYIISHIDSLQQLLHPEKQEHINRWSRPENLKEWKENVEVMRIFSQKRPAYQRAHMKDFFDLSHIVNIQLDVSHSFYGHIKINTTAIKPATAGIDQRPYPWTGKYFHGIPVEVEAIPSPGYRFSHWEGSSSSTSATITLNNDEDVFMKAHFEKTNEPVLIHYWLFDTSLPNNTPLENIHTSYSTLTNGKIEFKSCLEGYPYDENHTNWRKASMERRNAPTPLNYRDEENNHIPYADANIRGIQVKQPFVHHEKENKLILNLPTTGFSDIVLRFAAKDEGAVEQLIVDYSIDKNTDKWLTLGLSNNTFDIFGAYQKYQIDFTDINEVANNSDFKVRIRFAGEDLTEYNGERVTFNNISLDGIALGAHKIYSSAGKNGTIYPLGHIPLYDGSNREFLIKPYEGHQIKGVFVDGTDKTDKLAFFEGDSAVFLFEHTTNSHKIHAEFILHPDILKKHQNDLAVYPNPAGNEVTIYAVNNIKRVWIANMTGQVLKTYDNISTNNITLDLRSINSGIYVAIVHTEKGVVSQKLQIIK